MSWSDRLKNSLGLGTIEASMFHVHIEVTSYFLYKNGSFYRRGKHDAYRQVGLVINRASDICTCELRDGTLTINKENVMKFLKHWRDSGLYKVTLNGKDF